MSKLPPDPIFTLRNHTGEVTSLCFVDLFDCNTPYLISGSSSGELFLWDLKTYRIHSSLKAYEDSHILWIEYHNKNILTHGRNGLLYIWAYDNNGWSISRSISVSTVGFCQCDLSKDTSLIAVPGKHSSQIELIDMETGQIMSALTPTDYNTYGMCMCMKWINSLTNKQLILCGYENGTILLWDSKIGREISKLKCHKEPIFALDFNDKVRQQGLTCSAEEELSVFSIKDFMHLEEKCRISLPTLGASSVSIRHDGKIAASGGWDGMIRIFSCKSTKPLAYLNFHTTTVNCLKFYSGESGKHSKLLAAGSKDKRITLWSLYSDK